MRQVLLELVLSLIVAEITGLASLIARRIMERAAQDLPEPDGREMREHLETLHEAGMPLWPLIWAIGTWCSVRLSTWKRITRQEMGAWLATVQTRNQLRNARRELADVERLRPSRSARLMLLLVRLGIMLLGAVAVLVLLIAGAVLSSNFAANSLAVAGGTLLLLGAFAGLQYVALWLMPAFLDASLAVAFASVYTRYHPRALRRIKRLERKLDQLEQRKK